MPTYIGVTLAGRYYGCVSAAPVAPHLGGIEDRRPCVNVSKLRSTFSARDREADQYSFAPSFIEDRLFSFNSCIRHGILTAMATHRLLSPYEELQYHQLQQLQLWQRRQDLTDIRTDAAEKGLEGQSIPERWQLTEGISLHPWQMKAVDAWFGAGCRGVMKVVTGAGKTMLGLAIAQRLQNESAPNLRIAVVVPTIVLMDQWREEIVSRGNIPSEAIGLIGGGNDQGFGPETRIVIAVLSSAAKKLSANVRDAGVGPNLLLVVDECHRAGSAEMQNIFKTDRAFSLGLSATPERDNDYQEDEDEEGPALTRAQPKFEETILGEELGPVVFELSYAEAIQLGVLPPFTVRHYGLTLKPDERSQYERVSRSITELRQELERPGRKGLGLIRWCRSRAAASNPAAARLISLTTERKRLVFRMEERVNAVVEILRVAFRETAETKAILFHESIDEVMRLFQVLRAENIPVVAEHSEFPDNVRATSLRLFRDDAAKVIVSARSLIEGFNVPSADIGIIVAASSSVRQRVQTLGRLLRKARNRDGSEKHAVLHVLYASNTVDELIYVKADWEDFIGVDRNEYFLWSDVRSAPPQRMDSAPRSAAPSEIAISESDLQAGNTYPGSLDTGINFTRDTQGTIRTEGGALIEPNAELTQILKHSRKGAGRFRVTPARNFVVELEKTKEGWRGVYLGKIASEIHVLGGGTEELPDRDWLPGEEYPLAHAVGKTYSVLLRDSRLIATKEKGRTRFVSPLQDIGDLGKREATDQIQRALRTAIERGRRISKITVNHAGHALYVYNNQAFFLGSAPEGPEGFQIPNND